MRDLDSLPIVLHPSRPRFAAYAIFAALLGAIAWGEWHEPVAVVWIVLCGLSALLFCSYLLPGLAYLRLDETGFCYRLSLMTERCVPWSAVSKFSVVKGSTLGGAHVVEWLGVRRYQELDTPEGRRIVAGSEWGALPDPYGMNAEQLADLMTRLRERHGAQPGAAEDEA